MPFTPKGAGARLLAFSVLAGLLTATTATWQSPSAHASGGVEVYVGYADNLRAHPDHFPTPLQSGSGVIFEGCKGACAFDGGAVRIVNNSGSPVRIDSVAIKISTCTFNMWPAANVPSGSQLIVAQNTSGGSNGCTTDGSLDTSDVGPGGSGYAGNCTPDQIIPEVDVSIDGDISTFPDAGQILNTGGVDRADCPPGSNESIQWTPVGGAACAGSSLVLAPASQRADVGGTATVTATYANSCGDPLQGARVDFDVTAGPNAGATGSGATDSSGHASFKYSGAASGTDTVQASINNPAGKINANPVHVIWDPAISAQGGQSFSGTEPAAAGGTVATFTDTDTPADSATVFDQATVTDASLSALGISPLPVTGQSFGGPVATFTDANATTSNAGDFTATIDWGDGSPASAGTVTGSGGAYRVSGDHAYTGTGYFTVKVHIVDDGGAVADAQTKVLIYGMVPGGGFVIGDGNAATGTDVTFWGAQWRKLNTLSGGAGPASFKGFEDQPATPICGPGWTTDPGNSSRPPAGPLPAYLGVIVSSTISQTGPVISGDTPELVVVKTAPGYAPDSGHPGTGTVVAKIC